MRAFFKLNRSGFTLIIAYVVGVILIILTAGILPRAIGELNLARRNQAYIEAFYAAEGAIAQASFDLANRDANRQNVPVNLPAVTVNNLGNVNVSYTWTDLDGVDEVFVDLLGLTHSARHYRISAVANSTAFANISVTLNQIVYRNRTFTFQHMVFYNDDLEILPGPTMTFSGRVHCNHDIYIGSRNSLTVNSNYLHSAGNIYNARKNDPSDIMTGSVNIKNALDGSYALMKEAGESQALDSLRPDWTNESQDRWGGTVESSVHGATSLAVPAVGSIEPSGVDAYYANNAGLKIVNTTAYNSSGTQVALPANTLTQSTFYDKREGRNVTVTNINMGLLNTSTYFPSNGLLYATRTDSSSSQPNGVRLTNAATLSGALSVVSNDPVYIQGDYNTSNKPAAVISDALNILSNNWSDGNSSKSLSNRVANNTTVKAAFISGNVATIAGSTYSGGWENYPRFLEDWNGKTLNINGSFVGLWNSQIGLGVWGKSDVYNPPNRNWNYNTNFNNSASLPPFTPYAVEIKKVAWWKS